jgi:hypothetical protein
MDIPRRPAMIRVLDGKANFLGMPSWHLHVFQDPYAKNRRLWIVAIRFDGWGERYVLTRAETFDGAMGHCEEIIKFLSGRGRLGVEITYVLGASIKDHLHSRRRDRS